jgi:hypothetical protein
VAADFAAKSVLRMITREYHRPQQKERKMSELEVVTEAIYDALANHHRINWSQAEVAAKAAIASLTPTPAGHDAVERDYGQIARDLVNRAYGGFDSPVTPKGTVLIDHLTVELERAYQAGMQAALASVSAPPGFVLVPVEPTEAMLAALAIGTQHPEDLEAGKDAQRRGLMQVTPTYEMEAAYGQYRRLLIASAAGGTGEG